MSGSNSTSVPPWSGLALVILAVGVVTLGVTGGAAALPSETADVGDAIDGGENATEDSTKTVEEATGGGGASSGAAGTVDETASDVAGAGASTAETVESDADRAVNATKETADETTASAVDSIDGTTGLSTGDLSGDAQSSIDISGVLSSASGPGESVAASGGSHDRTVEGTAVAVSSANRAVPDAESTGSGADGPTSPLTSGGVALAGVVVGSVAVRRALSLAESFNGAGITRSTRQAVAARLGTPWRDRFWRVLGMVGYQRFDDSDPLEHDTRAAIHRVIEEREGAYLSEISRTTPIPLSTVRYHLRILEHERLVTPTNMRGKRFYFPADSEPSALRAALMDDGSAAVLRALARNGPDSVSGLAATLGRDVSTVTHHLQQLEDAGLVRRERDGQMVVNQLTPAVRDALADRTDRAEFDDGALPLEEPAT